MTRDKQLQSIDLDQVLEKRRLDQALNVKEFAVLAGISYSAARSWFRLPGFPAVRSVVFWADFVRWRRSQSGGRPIEAASCKSQHASAIAPHAAGVSDLPSRAAKILAEAG